MMLTATESTKFAGCLPRECSSHPPAWRLKNSVLSTLLSPSLSISLSVKQTKLKSGSRLRASEAAVHESDGGPAVPAEPAQHHPEEVRGGREEGRLLPVSGGARYRALCKFFNSRRICAVCILRSACRVLAGIQSPPSHL